VESSGPTFQARLTGVLPAAASGDLVQSGLARGSALRSSLTLISGTVASQALIFVLSPLLSRIFGPADFGDLANFNAWVSILGLASNLRYEQAILVERHRTGMNRVVALAFALSAASFALYLLIAVGIRLGDPDRGYVSEIKHIVMYMPFAILPNVVISALSLVHTRRGKFTRLASLAFLQAGVTTAAQITLGFLRVKDALIVGAMFGAAVAAVAFAVVHFRGAPFQRLASEFDWSRLQEVARTHFHFPRYSLPADAFNVVVQQFVPVFITAMFNPMVAGLYAFSTRVIRVPVFVISTAASTVLRKAVADRVNQAGTLFPTFRSATLALAAIGIVPFAVLGVYAAPIFQVVFGEEWRDAGTIVRILSPGIFLEFVALPLTAFFVITRKLRYMFWLQLANLVLLAAALYVGRRIWNDFNATCALMAAALVGVNLATIVLAGRVAGAPPATNDPRPVAT
jgi:O-antigen/teichoic acid export membrane protein